jgi:hypothetical protein
MKQIFAAEPYAAVAKRQKLLSLPKSRFKLEAAHPKNIQQLEDFCRRGKFALADNAESLLRKKS